PPAQRARRIAVLRRVVDRGSRRRLEGVSSHRQAGLGARAGLAVPRVERGWRVMDPADWRRIETVFAEALSKPPDARGAYLREACAGDADIRAELESLLEAHDASATFLEHLTRGDSGDRDLS